MRNRFNFSKSEKIGVAVLSLIILCLLIVLNIPRHTFIPDLIVEDTTAVEYIYPEKKSTYKPYNQKSFASKKHNSQITYQPFNPNEFSKNEWIEIGFSEKQARVILKYKQQLNGFKVAADLKDCFVINDQKFKEMQPYFRFDEPVIEEVVGKIQESQVISVDINTADAQLLETVSGIGPFFAKKIVEQRQKLGGFVSKIQLKELYGMTDENYERMVPQLSVNSNAVEPIILSEANFEQLKKHPYLNWKQSQVLVSLAHKVVDSTFWSALVLNEAFSENDINKLKPYLK